MGALGQQADGFGKIHPFSLLDEFNNVPTCVTAEAVKHLFSPVYRERRGIFVMKGTQPDVILAHLFQADVVAYHVHNVAGRPDLSNKIWRKNSSGHFSFPPLALNTFRQE
jgi:hypothetical protein